MTELEKAIASALRLSEPAAEKLLAEIQRNISTARSELIRSGVPGVVARSSHPLTEDAIITFCLSKMGVDDKQERYADIFISQEDNLRKSDVEVTEDQKADEDKEGS